MNNDDIVTVSMPRHKFIVVTNDHGGYKEGYCLVCNACGWIDKIEHTSDCPVRKEVVTDGS